MANAERVQTPEPYMNDAVQWAGTWQEEPVRAQKRCRSRKPSAQARSNSGLELRLAVGAGWIYLDLIVDGHVETVLGSSVFTDAFSDLVTAVRKSVADARPAWCSWNDEPGYTHIIFIPGPETSSTIIELWRDDSEVAPTARTELLLGRWQGPTAPLVAALYAASQSAIRQAEPRGVRSEWGYPPPTDELNHLSTWLADHNQQQ